MTMVMLSYATVGSKRLLEAKTLYDTFLGQAGIVPLSARSANKIH
jgi:hypothetical protein